MTTVLIDADILVYSIGFSSQTAHYNVYDSDSEITWEYSSIGEAKKAAGIVGVITTTIEPRAESVVESKLKVAIATIFKNTGADDKRLFLTGDRNFRSKVAVTFPYKGNRKMAKPVHYPFIRDTMVKEYGALIVNEEEADDMLGICQDDSTVIATIDKDLLMIPGRHYNINTGSKLIATDPGEIKLDNGNLTGYGYKWFCAQMLLGDPTDNIKCIKGMGCVGTYKELIKVTDPMEMWETVERQYQKHDMIHRIEENALLLWIRREPGQHPFDYIKEL